MTDLLIDPDCRDGKCTSCTGGACEHDCHAQVAVSQMIYQHPVYGALAGASLTPTVPPTWRVEPVGAGQSVVGPVQVDTYQEARNVLARMGEALSGYHRALNGARREAEAAMRATGPARWQL